MSKGGRQRQMRFWDGSGHFGLSEDMVGQLPNLQTIKLLDDETKVLTEGGGKVGVEWVFGYKRRRVACRLIADYDSGRGEIPRYRMYLRDRNRHPEFEEDTGGHLFHGMVGLIKPTGKRRSGGLENRWIIDVQAGTELPKLEDDMSDLTERALSEIARFCHRKYCGLVQSRPEEERKPLFVSSYQEDGRRGEDPRTIYLKRIGFEEKSRLENRLESGNRDEDVVLEKKFSGKPR